VADWYDNPPAESHTDNDTLWNRPDRGLPPIAEIVDGLLAEADARLDAIAARYGIRKADTEPKNASVLRKYGDEAS
jgi:hypothetical protein